MPQSEDRDRQLTAALRAVASGDEEMKPSAAVEARLLQEVRSIAWQRRRRTYVTIAPLAAALILIAALSIWQIVGRHEVPPSAAGTGAATDHIATAFLPLLYSNVPVSRVHTVVMDVPQSALASFGLMTIDSVRNMSGATVRAEVLVGEDGLARAVRFLQPVARQEQKQ